MTTKPTTAQKAILEAMQNGCVLTRTISTKYVPFNGNPEHSGTLRNPHVYHAVITKNILLSTIKAMEAKGLIAEERRYMSGSGTWEEHETETWCIIYKLADADKKPDHPHWTKGTLVTRIDKPHSVGRCLDDTYQSYDGNSWYNHVLWLDSIYTSIIRADRLKQAAQEVAHD